LDNSAGVGVEQRAQFADDNGLADAEDGSSKE
jgi:hypothetical protein